MNVELICGHGGYVACPALASAGVVGTVTFAYCAANAVKSGLVVTVVPSGEMVTIPNSPAALSAGKYEKAIPPDQTSAIKSLNSAPTSVQSRGGEVMHPNSLK